MNAKELQYMMETNEFSLAETLIIAELRRRDGVENVLRSEAQLWKDKYDDQSRSLEGHLKINEDMSRKIVELSMELERLHKGCMSAFPTCGCQERIKNLEGEITRLKSELERASVTNNGLADRLKDTQANLNAMYVSEQRRCEEALKFPNGPVAFYKRAQDNAEPTLTAWTERGEG